MIKIPFKRENFSSEMKPKISGANLSLEYDNIESSLMKVGSEIARALPLSLINRLSEEYNTTTSPEPSATAIDHLQRAILHFTIYEHLIFLITRVSNDGVTVKKNDDETTAYKYQTDALNNKLITTAWFWMNQLIQFLNDYLDDFSEWRDSDEKKAFDDLPVNLLDFNKWVGVAMTGGEYFMMCAGWIIREVWIDCVQSRFVEPEKTDAVTRAVCYEVMGRATNRLAYSALPEPIRIDIDNEMGKNHRAQADKFIREHIAGEFLQKAQIYWNAVDIEENRKNARSRPIIGQMNFNESDKFFYT